MAVSSPPVGGAAWPGTGWGWLVTGLAAAAALVWLFAPGIGWIADQWAKPEYSHGWLIPAVTLFLLWQRRERILAARGSGSWTGVGLVVLGLLVLVLSRLAFSAIPQAVALVLVLGGVGLAALGPAAMRYAWVPLLFLLFAVPLPAGAYYQLSTKLQLVSSWLGAEMLHALGISVFLDGNVIDLGAMQLQVAEACSGLRYLFPLSAFGFLCAWLYRGPLWAKAMVLLAILPLTVLLNSARIALTGIFVTYGSMELAEGFMHLFEGWVIFIVALAVLFALMWLLTRLAGRPSGVSDLLDFDRMAGAGIGPPRPTAARPTIVPLAASLGLLLAMTPVPDLLTGRSEAIPTRPGLVTLPLTYGLWQGRPASIDAQTAESLKASDYFLADFELGDGTPPVNYWIAYYDSQIGDAGTHSPQECLPGAGWEFVTLEHVPAPVTGDMRPFTMFRALVANGRQQILMYYWYEERGRQLTDGIWIRIYMMLDALTKQRSDGALVRLITPVLPGEPIDAADRRLTDFFRLAYPSLGPHVGA
jgi:exosortase D (VPLPA-CTERM-specific)